jgi:hypothetical protein
MIMSRFLRIMIRYTDRKMLKISAAILDLVSVQREEILKPMFD